MHGKGSPWHGESERARERERQRWREREREREQARERERERARERERERERQSERERERERARERERERERARERERERASKRERERETERQRARASERERERESVVTLLGPCTTTAFEPVTKKAGCWLDRLQAPQHGAAPDLHVTGGRNLYTATDPVRSRCIHRQINASMLWRPIYIYIYVNK